MEKFFESESLTEDEMREGIRKGLVTRSIFPVFCVCAGKDMGVRRLMEFLGNVVPFVSESPKVKNTAGKEITPDTAGSTFQKSTAARAIPKTHPPQPWLLHNVAPW